MKKSGGYEADVAMADVCRRHGISSVTFDKWKATYGGLEVSGAQRLRPLEDENVRLNRLLADATLDKTTLTEISAKNSEVAHLQAVFELRRLRACDALGVDQTTVRNVTAGRTMQMHVTAFASWRCSGTSYVIADCTGCCPEKGGR